MLWCDLSHNMEFEKEFELAKKVILETGQIAHSYFIKKLEVTYHEDNSFLTRADIECENFIRSRLESAYPSYGFIGEETQENIRDTAWIIDPIDGTVSFARQMPEYGIALALKRHNDIIFSVQYLPESETLLHAYI